MTVCAGALEGRLWRAQIYLPASSHGSPTHARIGEALAGPGHALDAPYPGGRRCRSEMKREHGTFAYRLSRYCLYYFLLNAQVRQPSRRAAIAP